MLKISLSKLIKLLVDYLRLAVAEVLWQGIFVEDVLEFRGFVFQLLYEPRGLVCAVYAVEEAKWAAHL